MKTEERIARRTIFPMRIFYGWYMVAAGMGLHLWVSIAWVYGIQLFITPLTQTFGWSRALISGAFSLQRLEGSAITPIEGFLVDRFGPRWFMVAGAFIIGLGFILLSLINSIWMFYAGVMTISLGMSLCMGVPRTWAIVQWFQRLRGRALGIGGSGAFISGPLLIIVVLLIDNLGWRQAFQVLGIATWVICMPLCLVFRGRPHQYGQLPDGGPPKGAQDGSPQVAAARGGQPEGDFKIRQALTNKSFWLLTVIFAAQGFGTSGLIVHMIPYFESIGFTRAQAASVIGYFTVLSVFARVGGGWVADYFDKRIVLAGILACSVASFVLMANITAYWQVIPFALVFGTAFGAMIPTNGVVISAYFGARNFGAISGFIQMGTAASGIIAPVLMGWIYDETGSYKLAIYVLIGVAAAGIPVTFFARPPRPRVESPV